MPLSFTFEGSFFRLSDFMREIERFIVSKRSSLDVRGRLLTLDGFALEAGREGFPQMKATIAATAYLVPADQGVTNGATAAAPGAQPAGGIPAPSPSAPSGTPAASPATVIPGGGR